MTCKRILYTYNKYYADNGPSSCSIIPNSDLRFTPFSIYYFPVRSAFVRIAQCARLPFFRYVMLAACKLKSFVSSSFVRFDIIPSRLKSEIPNLSFWLYALLICSCPLSSYCCLLNFCCLRRTFNSILLLSTFEFRSVSLLLSRTYCTLVLSLRRKRLTMLLLSTVININDWPTIYVFVEKKSWLRQLWTKVTRSRQRPNH